MHIVVTHGSAAHLGLSRRRFSAAAVYHVLRFVLLRLRRLLIAASLGQGDGGAAAERKQDAVRPGGDLQAESGGGPGRAGGGSAQQERSGNSEQVGVCVCGLNSVK